MAPPPPPTFPHILCYSAFVTAMDIENEVLNLLIFFTFHSLSPEIGFTSWVHLSPFSPLFRGKPGASSFPLCHCFVLALDWFNRWIETRKTKSNCKIQSEGRNQMNKWGRSCQASGLGLYIMVDQKVKTSQQTWQVLFQTAARWYSKVLIE